MINLRPYNNHLLGSKNTKLSQSQGKSLNFTESASLLSCDKTTFFGDLLVTTYCDTSLQDASILYLLDSLALSQAKVLELEKALTAKSEEKVLLVDKIQKFEQILNQRDEIINEQHNIIQTFRLEAEARREQLCAPLCPESSSFQQNSTARENLLEAELNELLIKYNAILLENQELKSMVKCVNDKYLGALEKLGKPRPDSSNSGISPSKDPPGTSSSRGKISKPEDNASKKSRGGQIGHKPHFRPLFNLDELEHIYEYGLTPEDKCLCSYCGSDLVREPSKDNLNDQYLKPPTMIEKNRHIVLAYRCEKCGKIHYGLAPKAVTKGGLFHYSLLVEMLLLKLIGNQTIRKIRDLFKYSYDIEVSHSYINNCLKDVSLIFRPIFLEILDNIKYEHVLNIDETVHKFCGKQIYDWVFKGERLVAHKIGTRDSNTLNLVLGNRYEGIIGSDCYSVYLSYVKKHPDVTIQLCLAHLRRDFVHCSQFLNNEVQNFGNKGIELIDKLFHWHHEYQKVEDKTSIEALTYHHRLINTKKALIEHAANPRVLMDKAKGISRRFTLFPENYFTFIDNPEIGPTNNAAEISIRGVVVERKISYGTQSILGNWASETFWSIRGTLELNQIDIREFLTSALVAYYEGKPLPSLVNIGKTVDPKYIEQTKTELKILKEQEKYRKNTKKDNKIEAERNTIKSNKKRGQDKSNKVQDILLPSQELQTSVETLKEPSLELKTSEEILKELSLELKSSEDTLQEPSLEPKSCNEAVTSSLNKKNNKRVSRNAPSVAKKRSKNQYKSRNSQKKDESNSQPTATKEASHKSIAGQSFKKSPPANKHREQTKEAPRLSSQIIADRTTHKRLLTAPGPSKNGSGASPKGFIAPKGCVQPEPKRSCLPIF
jgi:transposase